MKDPAALNVVARARELVAAFDGLRAALDKHTTQPRARSFSKVCRHCRDEFAAHRLAALYCSDVCRAAARRERNAA